MALVVHLRCVENLRGTADRFVKLRFRGHVQRTKLVHCAKCAAYFGEKFEWPVARPAEADEFLHITLLNSNKYLSNRAVGSYTLLLQALIKDGQLKLVESLVDRNNRLLLETISFEVFYYSPDGSVGNWGQEEFCYPVMEVGEGVGGDDVSVRPDLPAALEETQFLRPNHGGDSVSTLSGSESLYGEDTTSQAAIVEAMQLHNKGKPQFDLERELHRAKEFQVCVRILEVQQLAGLNVDPVVRVEVGTDHKYTSIKESTNCPYYNEYFVFDFYQSPAAMFDKMISISVSDALNIPGRRMLKIGNVVAGKMIGTFKCDVGTVYAATDHRYYHKWAVLLDSKDLSDGIKGYVKCDIAVIGKGDAVKIPKHVKENDQDNIEGNLLLPAGVSADRQRAVYTVTVFEAEDLPQCDVGILASMRKVISQASHLSSYVKVSFLGHVGKTSVQRGQFPKWREVIQFMDMFPPLCNRLKIQLCEDDALADDVLATHHIELAQIMDPGSDTEGILPTFGPNWIYLYGGTGVSGSDQVSLNNGVGEGCVYRGRLLVSIRTQILAESLSGPASVYSDKLRIATRTDLAPRKEFMLVGTIFEATMIDKEYAGRPIYFELSIGRFGNTLDPNPADALDVGSSDSESTDVASRSLRLQLSASRDLVCESGSEPQRTSPTDAVYQHVALGADKPCLYVGAVFEDLTKRLHHVNMLKRMADSMADGVSCVRSILSQQPHLAALKLRSILIEFCAACRRYAKMAASLTVGIGSGKTKLDRYRQRMCKGNVERLASLADDIRHQITDINIKEKFRETRCLLQKLQPLAKEPQQSMPDVFIWMIHGKTRVAYHRIAAHDLIHSITSDTMGKACGKTQSFFLKKPGKLSSQSAKQPVQAKLEMYLWLGKREMHRSAAQFFESLPGGYELPPESLQIGASPPSVITYTESSTYQLCVHLSQARSVIGSDQTGLSDPFARVLLAQGSGSTRVIDETLSPVWNETVCLRDITLYGAPRGVAATPPLVVVEFYDYDRLGDPEFLGRTLAYPRVKLSETAYLPPDWPPQLAWWDIERGQRNAGELLAAFELLQGKWEDFPHLTALAEPGGDQVIVPIPPQIRPTLSKYRIEVVFWGVREPRRIQLFSVDRPRVDIECAGNVLQSRRIDDYEKNSNFDEPLAFMDIDLPDNATFWPPITIRCVDCRKFGREVLVGTCTVSQLQQYVELSPQDSLQAKQLALMDNGSSQANVGDRRSLSSHTKSDHLSDHWSPHGHSADVVINMSESTSGVDSGYQAGRKGQATGKAKTEPKLSARQWKKREELMEDLDWWSKYYVAKEDLQKKNEESDGDDEVFSESDEELEKDHEVTAVTMVDYRSMDHSRLDELQATADKQYEDSLSKKKRKKREKLRAKLEKLEKLKGFANEAFQMHDKDLLDLYDEIAAEDKSYITRLKIFPTELESVPEFGGFTELFQTFDLLRGKKVDDSDDDQFRVSAKFKGALCIYPKDEADPDPVGRLPKLRLLTSLPSVKPFELQVLVYIVQASDLHPVDLNGKADPYLVLKCGRREINDKSNRQSKQLNPVFGRLFEFDVKFPMDSLLRIQLMDYDMLSADDLIGETTIDLENRFFSKHRVSCGLQAAYDTSGYNVWRDPYKPTEILANLCKQLKVAPPVYKPTSCSVASSVFIASTELADPTKVSASDEQVALQVLRNWHTVPGGCRLVPEHIETRTLYCADRPGIQQGKLEMWVDMFPKDKPPPNVTVDIKPRQPKSYQLRVIIWNTSDVKLEDSNLVTGERSSDIFVRGYLKGMGEDDQKTDVHYRSLTGEGNFNWRFIFPFDYLKAEEKIVFARTESLLFDFDESQLKVPAKLTLQVWDADIVSADDFLGAVTLNLNRIPRPAKYPKDCSERLLATDGSVPTLNLFKNLRCRGWWPMVAKEEDSNELTGKVEMELHLVTSEEAEKSAVGLGREEPHPLSPPNRPDTSFLWFMNPLKTLKYVIWKNFKWKLLKLLLIIIVVAFVVLFFYSAPGATINKIFGL